MMNNLAELADTDEGSSRLRSARRGCGVEFATSRHDRGVGISVLLNSKSTGTRISAMKYPGGRALYGVVTPSGPVSGSAVPTAAIPPDAFGGRSRGNFGPRMSSSSPFSA